MKQRLWTDIENEYVIEHYPNDLTADVARHLNRSSPAVANQAHILGLYKSDKFVHPTRYKKGNTPASKGKKMSPEQYEKCKANMFKKGHFKSRMPIGTITLRHNYKRNNHYFWIKIAEPEEWVLLHRYNWEKKYGPIPKGLNLVFKDGNTTNCELKNLELITRQEIMRRNTIHNRYPDEIKKTIMALGYLKRKINTYERKRETQ